jgi:hypothetical protein
MKYAYIARRELIYTAGSQGKDTDGNESKNRTNISSTKILWPEISNCLAWQYTTYSTGQQERLRLIEAANYSDQSRHGTCTRNIHRVSMIVCRSIIQLYTDLVVMPEPSVYWIKLANLELVLKYTVKWAQRTMVNRTHLAKLDRPFRR